MRALVTTLADKLKDETSANIVPFLAHLSKDPTIAEKQVW